jgi:hypothetical protein
LDRNAESLKALPPPETKKRRGNRLATLGGLTREGVRIYWAMKKGRMDCDKGRSLIWALSQLRCMVEAEALTNIEARLEQLAQQPPHAREPSRGQLVIEHQAGEHEILPN